MSTEKSNGGPFVTFREECEILRGRVSELEAQLADHKKLLLLAKQEFYRLACLGNGDRFGNSEGNIIAQEAIAKINGPVEGMILCEQDLNYQVGNIIAYAPRRTE